MRGNTNSKWESLLEYNIDDVMLSKRMEELEYMNWLNELKNRWGIFWRIPYWWHRGKRPVLHGSKF